MERISRRLEQAGGEALPFRRFKEDVTGNEGTKVIACDVLRREGYITIEDGPRGSRMHTLLRPYRQSSDPLADAFDPDTIDRRPIVSRPSPGDDEATVSLSPLLRDRRLSTGTVVTRDDLTVSPNRTCPLHGTELKPEACYSCDAIAVGAES